MKREDILESIYFPDEYRRLIAHLKAIYGNGLRIEDVLNLTGRQILDQRSFGKKSAILLENLKTLLVRNLSSQQFLELITDGASLEREIRCVPSRYQQLFRKLKAMSPIRTYHDVWSVLPETFSRRGGVTEEEVVDLLEWQKEILSTRAYLYGSIDAFFQKLSEYRLNEICCADDERMVLNKFRKSKAVGDTLTPVFLMKQNGVQLSDMKSFGRTSQRALSMLQAKIEQFMCDLDHFEEVEFIGAILVSEDFGSNCSMTKLARIFIEDARIFFQQQPADDRLIWMHRVSYKEKKCTLDELGKFLGITRERVRQRQQKLMASFARSNRLSPSGFAALLESYSRVDDLYGDFRSADDLLDLLTFLSQPYADFP